jgi:hypothetical protein
VRSASKSFVWQQEVRLLTFSFERSRKRGKGKKISEFYSGQNEHIANLLKPLRVHTQEANDAEEAAASSVRWAIRLSFIANFALAGLQVSWTANTSDIWC